MQNENKVPLDEKSLGILYLLSSCQPLIVEEIASSVDLEVKDTVEYLKYLNYKHFVDLEKGLYKISKPGMDYILKKGMQIPKSPKTTTPPTPITSFAPPLVGTWRYLIYWQFYLVATMILFVGLGLIIAELFTKGSWQIAIIGISVFLWLVAIIITIKKTYHSVPEYERLVIFQLGKCVGARGPGPVLILPFVDIPRIVDLRVKHQEIPHEVCITQDDVQIDVDFVFYWKIEQPVLSITIVKDPEESIKLLATALLRAVIANFQFIDVLNKRESINDMLKLKIDDISKDWGVKITMVEIREIRPPDEIVKSMHKKLEAEWSKKATVTNAEAQAEALRLLFQIASSIDDKTLCLKYLEMLKELGQGESTKFIFPMELTDLVKRLQKTLELENEENDI